MKLAYKPVTGAYEIPLDKITASPFQPRHIFPEDKMDELRRSIEQHGVLQPITLRPHPMRDGWFQLVSGERRWRATEGVRMTIPAIVRELNDLESAEIALAENIQRSTLTSLEEAEGIKRLVDQWNKAGVEFTEYKLAEKLSVTKAYVTKALKLLNLPDDFLAVAGRKTNVKTSLLLIAEQPEGEQPRLLEMVNNDASYREIERSINEIETEKRLKAASSAASSFPDRHTQERATAHARGERATVGRGGAIVRSGSALSPSMQSRNAVAANMEGIIRHLEDLTDADFHKYLVPFARRILTGDLRRD